MSSTKNMQNKNDVQRISQKLKKAIGQIIVGYSEPIELLLCALLSGGHILLEDVPGVGKTTLAQTIASASGLEFQRIQFTPDLLPSDVTGTRIFRPDRGEFEFQPGPVFTNILLADEINRATPRTQSALLECMQEGQVTTSGLTRKLPQPFLTLATQNPLDIAGTFPLPAAQLDRFLLRITLGYPDESEELEIIKRSPKSGQSVNFPAPVTTPGELSDLAQQVEQVFLSDELAQYVVSLVQSTREDHRLRLGASPRAAVMLTRASRSLALLRGRCFVLPDDIQDLVVPVLSHRLITSEQSLLRHDETSSILHELLDNIPVPEE